MGIEESRLAKVSTHGYTRYSFPNNRLSIFRFRTALQSWSSDHSSQVRLLAEIENSKSRMGDDRTSDIYRIHCPSSLGLSFCSYHFSIFSVANMRLSHISVLAAVIAGSRGFSTSPLNSRSCNSSEEVAISQFIMPLCNGIDIEDATIDDLQHFMTMGKLTSEQLVECYMARIEQTNS